MKAALNGASILGIIYSVGVFADENILISAQERLKRVEKNGAVIYKGDALSIRSNETLVFDEPATVFLEKLNMEEKSVLDSQGNDLKIFVSDDVEAAPGSVVDVSFSAEHDTSGSDGASGKNGEKAQDALKGVAGGHGSDATNGGHGGDAADISILAPYIRGNIILRARGGNGGNGGTGGAGGIGGDGLGGSDARTLYYFKYLDNQGPAQMLQLGAMIGIPYLGQVLAVLTIFNGTKIGDGFDGYNGGNGGNGGRGGSGGNGGNGGNINLVFGKQIDGTKIYVNTRGGSGGAAGAGGIAGIGGHGGEGGKRGDIWAREGEPGQAGLQGSLGEAGRPGQPGKSGKVKVTETSDPAWVMCYVRYRELADMGDDMEFAREVLRSCSN